MDKKEENSALAKQIEKIRDSSRKPPRPPKFTPIKYEEVMREKAEKEALKSRIRFFKRNRELKKQGKAPEGRTKEIKKEVPEEKKEKIKEKKPEIKEKKETSGRKTLILIIFLSLVAVVLILIYLFSFSEESNKELVLGQNIDSAYLEDDVIYVRLLPVDFSTIDKIDFIITDYEGKNHVHPTYYLDLNHEIYPEDFSLENFDNIQGIGADFEYISQIPVPPGENQTTNQTSPPSCTNECSREGMFCDINTPYNCSLGEDGCYDRADFPACQAGELCLNGVCETTANCTTDSDCEKDGCYNGEYRDYYCNSLVCSYADLTSEETGNNCNDGRDNDCDGNTDSSDSGCSLRTSVCNDGILDIGEVCDGEYFGGKTCADFFIYGSGTDLSCCENCTKANLRNCRNYTYTFCMDSDGGINYNIPSSVSVDYDWRNGPNCTDENPTVFGSGGDYEIDRCDGDILVEYYCEDDNSPGYVEYDCTLEGKTCNLGVCERPLFPTLNFWEGIKELIGA